nr:MAG: putative silencing suppressor protein [Tombusviridae sp.]
MEGAEGWVLHPHRCEACSHSTYLRESWSDGNGKVSRRIRHEPQPCVVPVQGVQPWPWVDHGGESATFLPTGRGISYSIRGHGVTVTVCGHSNDVYNISRVANDVVCHPIIQGEVCIRGSPPTCPRRESVIQTSQNQR